MNILWYQLIYQQTLIQGWLDIFMMILESTFASLSDITLDDFLRLPPTRGKFILSRFSVKNSMKYLHVRIGVTLFI